MEAEGEEAVGVSSMVVVVVDSKMVAEGEASFGWTPALVVGAVVHSLRDECSVAQTVVAA